MSSRSSHTWKTLAHQSSRKTRSASTTCLQTLEQTWWLRRRINDSYLDVGTKHIAWPLLLVTLSSSVGNLVVPGLVRHPWRDTGIHRGDLEQGPNGALWSILFAVVSPMSSKLSHTWKTWAHQSSHKTRSASITCLQTPEQTRWPRRRPNACYLI